MPLKNIQMLCLFLLGSLLWGGFLFLCPGVSFGDVGWTLWKGGNSSLGDVSVITVEGVPVASIQGTADLLGINLQEKKDALVLSKGSRKASFTPGDIMVFVNGEIFPLTAPIHREAGVWRAEAQGLLKVMEMLLYGKGIPPSPLTWQGNSGTVRVDPAKEKKATSPGSASEKALEKWRKELGLSTASSSSGGGGVRRLRWHEYPGKVRLVLDMAEPVYPKVEESPGKLVLHLDSPLKGQLQGGNSPCPGKVSMAKRGDRSLAFTHHAEKVETFSLGTPPRFVVDFFYPFQKKEEAPKIELENVVQPPIAPMAPPEPVKPRGKPLVVVDAGHGGKDPGALGNGLREKDIALIIAKFLSEELQKRGFAVLLTRNDDRYLKLRERTDYANAKKADAFISVHLNALPKGRHAKGMEIYIMALPSDKDAMALAKIENREIAESVDTQGAKASDAKTEMLLRILGDMQQNAKITSSLSFAETLFDQGKKAQLPMRRIAQAPFFVLRGAGMPAVLVETGFISEKSEARQLARRDYQRKIAKALAEGVALYFK